MTLEGILKSVREVQPENAASSITSISSGTVIFLTDEKPSKVYAGIFLPPVTVMLVSDFGIFNTAASKPCTEYIISFLPSRKRYPSHDISPSLTALRWKPANGSVSSSRAVQPLKTKSLMFSVPSPMTAFFSEVQPLNAYEPMDFTALGTFISLIASQPVNA